jgi:beta-galactosidase
VKLNGVCLHSDLGGLGAAVYPDAIRRQLTLLRAMGANAIRTAHNPPATAFMDLADEMGFLVLSEILDMWQRPKNPYDYARFFDDWIERDMAAWIRRDRNHPSVILWSVGNEIYDTHADAEAGSKTLRLLLDLVKKHDPKGHAPATLCSNYMPWKNTQACMDLVKIAGYNYGEFLYQEHHKQHPDWVLYGSETCSTVQSRGVYHFPLSQSQMADDDLQCSALGNSSTSWGAPSVEACLLTDLHTPFSLGQFLWAGQDYLGEPTPYDTKNAYFGHLDTAGFPKDSYYTIQAAWTETPMIHLFPYWDFSKGQPIDVRVCTSAPKVELFLNDQSLGTKELNGRWLADWQVHYQPGTLRAVAYDEKGSVIAQATRQSFGDAAELRVDCQRHGALTFAAITAVDGLGRPVENANCRVQVAVEGGALLALDNGDSTDREPYQSPSRRLFSGRLLAIVQSHGEGDPHIAAEFDREDIPIRKVELVCNDTEITARTYPPDATHHELIWRLTDAAGIDSPLGVLTVAEDGRSATVLPKGDGTVYVRCSPTNGRAHPAFVAVWPLTFSGLGKPFLDPYGFLSGGLYTDSNAALTNGNERGVATLRDGESHVGFRDLDFGDYGSDEVTLWLFPLEKEPFPFELWEGMPRENGVRICTVLYDKGSIWNTYQPVVCRLPRRLHGVTTLCLLFRQKVHIKGFQFTPLQKAFQRLSAADNDGIYGDSFTLRGEAVEGIGNNVTLTWRDMDFGPAGATRVALCWRSQRVKNSVQLILEGGAESRQMMEVGLAPEYTEAVFTLDTPVTGDHTVSLLFLPGCELDLAWIEFLA